MNSLFSITIFNRFAKNITVKLPHGFTLLEVIVVIAIVGILATISIGSYFAFIEKAKITKAIAEIGLLEKEIIGWHDGHEGLPANLDEINREGLLDPWGNPYQFLNFTTVDDDELKRKDNNLVPVNDDYDLYSMGRDGASQASLTAAESRDDIIRAQNGHIKGIASRYF